MVNQNLTYMGCPVFSTNSNFYRDIGNSEIVIKGDAEQVSNSYIGGSSSGDFPYQQPVVNPINVVDNPLGGYTQPGLGLPGLTVEDVKRIVEEHLKTYIKDKEKKTPCDLILLMKEYKFPEEMILIVQKALGQEWPEKKEAKPREEDLIHG